MTAIDWTQPIELDTAPPRPARVLNGPDEDGDYEVLADWHGDAHSYPLIVDPADGTILGISCLPRVRNVTPAPDLVPMLVEALRECADELEAEIEAKRGTVLPRTTERDLAPVRKARAAVAAVEARK